MDAWGRRGRRLALALALAGCGTDVVIDDRFTAAEWDFLQTFRLPALDPVCPPDLAADACDAAARFGQLVFFDPSYSGPLLVGSDLGDVGDEGRVSCASCHVADAWFRDDRSPGGTSLGAGWTKRNAPSLVNAAYQRSFTWDGRYQSLARVIEAPLDGEALLNSDVVRLARAVCTNHAPAYEAAFGPLPTDCDQDAARIVDDVAIALEAYQRRLTSADAPFDRYLDGDFAAIDDAAKRGLALFIGDALCSECHHGPLLSDESFHVTGVAQRGLHVPAEDEGRGDGAFRTPGLRNVAETAPYLHTGQLATLGDVVEFYRWGGDAGGFVGEKDRLMLPLDLGDDDAADLVAFLESLTGAEVPAALRVATPP